MRDGNVSARDAGEYSRDEKQRQCIRQPHESESDRRSRDAHHQDRAPAEPIGQLSEDRREDDLHARVNAREPANGDRRGVKMFRIKRQDRNDDAEAHEIDKDREEEDKER